jgi:hypothetical protein
MISSRWDEKSSAGRHAKHSARQDFKKGFKILAAKWSMSFFGLLKKQNQRIS